MAIRLVDMEIASLRQQVKELCAARDWLAREKERVEKQRDEARELVRGAVSDLREMRKAIARWDEEEEWRKRSDEVYLAGKRTGVVEERERIVAWLTLHGQLSLAKFIDRGDAGE